MERTAVGHVDHVILGVRDVDDTATRLHDEFGFLATGVAVVDGTPWVNRAVPLGRGSYLELLGVGDPSAPEAAGLAALVAERDRLVAWAVRLHDLGPVARRAGVRPVPGGRGGAPSPRWWTVDADPDRRTNGFLPFFISYGPDADASHLEPHHTGAARTVDGIAVLELAGPGPEPILDWLDDLPPEIRVVDGEMAIRALEIRTAAGGIRLE